MSKLIRQVPIPLPVPGPKNAAAPLNSGSELGHWQLPFLAKHKRHARESLFNIVFFPSRKHLDFQARFTNGCLELGTWNTFLHYTINSRAHTYFFLKTVTRKCEHKTGDRVPHSGSVLIHYPQKDNLSHFSERNGVSTICTQHCTTDERQTETRNMEINTNSHLKTPEAHGEQFQTLGGSEKDFP